MATRLYPQTSNPSNLEKLAGVPEGTAAKYQALRDSLKGDAFYDALYSDGNEDLLQFNNFSVYGWGRFQSCGMVDDPICGSMNNLSDCKALLALNGISVDVNLTEGLSWS